MGDIQYHRESFSESLRKRINVRELKPNPNVDDKLCKAYHEAGHLYFHILYDIWFEYVTLLKDDTSEASIHHHDFEFKDGTQYFLMGVDVQTYTNQ
jgi:hypothetical protein